MAIAFPQEIPLDNNEKKYSFYTEDEMALLYQLENGLVQTKSHDQVMEDLRKALNLEEK